ncbi:DUF4190 domain-containing protein [Streptomyces sp. NPDC057702]|uniref:DUF4190 domain-containing protein n=1 Tax=unclassified Streptomyces TaxID=2593676 RepID=UPI003676F087
MGTLTRNQPTPTTSQTPPTTPHTTSDPAPSRVPTPPLRRSDRPRDADGMAVASFVLGLIGLLVFNLVFGPCAIALAITALLRGTTRKGRALLGLTLGTADLVVLFTLLATNDTLTWQFGG